MNESLADVPALTRSGETDPLGKCNFPLKTDVPEIMLEDFYAMARMNNMRPAEYLRDLVRKHLYGELQTARMKVTRMPFNGERPE